MDKTKELLWDDLFGGIMRFLKFVLLYWPRFVFLEWILVKSIYISIRKVFANLGLHTAKSTCPNRFEKKNPKKPHWKLFLKQSTLLGWSHSNPSIAAHHMHRTSLFGSLTSSPPLNPFSILITAIFFLSNPSITPYSNHIQGSTIWPCPYSTLHPISSQPLLITKPLFT